MGYQAICFRYQTRKESLSVQCSQAVSPNAKATTKVTLIPRNKVKVVLLINIQYWIPYGPSYKSGKHLSLYIRTVVKYTNRYLYTCNCVKKLLVNVTFWGFEQASSHVSLVLGKLSLIPLIKQKFMKNENQTCLADDLISGDHCVCCR